MFNEATAGKVQKTTEKFKNKKFNKKKILLQMFWNETLAVALQARLSLIFFYMPC